MATARTLKSFRHDELFRREADTTLATIAAALGGAPVPQTPEQDATESALAANAVQWIAEDVEPARVAAAKDAADILACTVPLDEPGHIAGETQRQIYTTKADHEKQVADLDHDLKMTEAELFIEANTDKTGFAFGSRTAFAAKAGGLFIGEATMNAYFLALAGIPGGITRTAAVAGVFAMINLILGMFGGSVLASKRRNHGQWTWSTKARVAGVGLLAIAANLLMALAQFLAKHLLSGKSPGSAITIDLWAAVQAMSAMIIGLVIVYMIAKTWSRVASANVRRLLLRRVQLTAGIQQAREEFQSAVIAQAYAGDQALEDLRDNATNTVLNVRRTAIDTGATNDRAGRLQGRICKALEGAVNLNRATLRASLPAKSLPAHVGQPANCAAVMQTLPNLDAINRHVDGLGTALAALDRAILAARINIARVLQGALDIPNVAGGTSNDALPPMAQAAE